jgi:hypothetical protein
LCKYTHGKIVGDLFPFNPTDSDSLEMHDRFKATGEKWGFHRTDVLRQFPHHVEEIIGFFIPESVLWNKIAKKYKTRLVNEALRMYWRDQPSIMRNSQHPKKALLGGKSAIQMF